MAVAKQLPDASFLRECFSYSESDGLLTWKRRPRSHFPSDGIWKGWNTRYAMTSPSYVNNKGYRTAYVDGRLLLVHRIAWKIVTGADPTEQIDHINGDRLDNSWRNLRSATHTQNVWNTKRSKRTLPTGVYVMKGRFGASIKRDGRAVHLGYFSSSEEAGAAYKRAEADLRGDFLCSGAIAGLPACAYLAATGGGNG